MSSPDEGKDDTCNCINLRRAANAVTEYYDRTLAPAGLTVNQYSLVSNLNRIAPCSVSDLADRVRLERTTLVRALKSLMALDYIADLSLPGQRNRQLCVTESGLDRLRVAEPLWEQAQMGVLAQIGAENLKMLTDALFLLEML